MRAQPWLLTWVLSCTLGCSQETGPTAASARDAVEFLRFVPEENGKARLETALLRLEDAQHRQVDLIGAVHIADEEYYRLLNRLFTGYEAVLYELVAPKGTVPEKDRSAASWVTLLQRFLQESLKLTYQLDVVNYSAPNMVHADLDPESFARLQEEAGETLFSAIFHAMLQSLDEEALKRQSADQLTLFLSVFSPNRAYLQKTILARQFGEIETAAAGFGVGPDGKPSVLVGRRNEEAVRVLEVELAAGRKRLAIFYGAAHLPDFELRLKALGFHRQRVQWLTAWTLIREETAGK